MPRSQVLLALLCCLPLAASVRCHTCVFPTASHEDCLKSPLECPGDQRCLSSVAKGYKGAVELTLYEKGCVVPSQCGLTGLKFDSGIYFNFTNTCCTVDLCNGATSTGLGQRDGVPVDGAPLVVGWYWRLVLGLLPAALLLLLA